MKMNCMIVLSVLALSTAAMAADGSASFYAGGAVVSFNYDADMQAGMIMGSMTLDGTSPVKLMQDRAGNWSGSLGNVSITAKPAQVDAQGVGSIEIQTMRGIFDYTMETDKKGNIEISAISPMTGEMLGADLSKDGSSFSVAMNNMMSVGLEQDSSNTTHYDGTVFMGWDSESAMLDVTGTMDMVKLAKSNPSLFILLYVLPFNLSR